MTVTAELVSENRDLKAKLSQSESKLSQSETQRQSLEAQFEAKSEQFEKEALRFKLRAEYYEAQYESVIQSLRQAQREKFASTSERFEDENQVPLFESGLASEETEDEIEEITYVRKKPNKKPLDLSTLPTREILIPVTEEERRCECGCLKEVIRYEKSSKLNHIPAKLEVLIEKREVVACRKGCDGSVITAALPKVVLPKAKATETLLAHIIVSKVLDRNPLYHLEKKFERQYAWRIPRQTMARWMIELSDKLQPLINLMKDEVLGYDIASCDATSLQVLKEPKRHPTKKSYAYCIRGGPPDKEVTLFEYNGYSQKDYVDELFDGYKGFIHTDADPVFNKVSEQPGITLSLCNAHARRKFEQIYKSTKKKDGLAKHAMKVFQELYKIERDATERGLTTQERVELRQREIKPIMMAFKDWLDDKSDLVMPKSPIGKAIAYSRSHWDGLIVFLEDGRLRPDNNHTENEIRPFVIARKNFLFSCTMAGADALGVHFSLILTAKHHGWDPYRYYVEILKHIPLCKTIADYEALLPWNLNIPNP